MTFVVAMLCPSSAWCHESLGLLLWIRWHVTGMKPAVESIESLAHALWLWSIDANRSISPIKRSTESTWDSKCFSTLWWITYQVFYAATRGVRRSTLQKTKHEENWGNKCRQTALNAGVSFFFFSLFQLVATSSIWFEALQFSQIPIDASPQHHSHSGAVRCPHRCRAAAAPEQSPCSFVMWRPLWKLMSSLLVSLNIKDSIVVEVFLLLFLCSSLVDQILNFQSLVLISWHQTSIYFDYARPLGPFDILDSHLSGESICRTFLTFGYLELTLISDGAASKHTDSTCTIQYSSIFSWSVDEDRTGLHLRFEGVQPVNRVGSRMSVLQRLGLIFHFFQRHSRTPKEMRKHVNRYQSTRWNECKSLKHQHRNWQKWKPSFFLLRIVEFGWLDQLLVLLDVHFCRGVPHLCCIHLAARHLWHKLVLGFPP